MAILSPEQGAGFGSSRARTGSKAHATMLGTVAGLDLCFHHKAPAAEFFRSPLRVRRLLDDVAQRDFDTKPGQQLLGLKFVKVHVRCLARDCLLFGRQGSADARVKAEPHMKWRSSFSHRSGIWYTKNT